MIRLVEVFRASWYTVMGRRSRDHAAEMPIVQWLKEQQQDAEQKAAQSEERLQRVNIMEQAFLSDPSRKRGTQ